MTGRRLPALPLLLGALLAAAGAVADVPVPVLTGRVVDQAGVLSDSQRTALETRLADLEQRKGSQLAVLLLPTTAPETIEQYALRVVEAWQLGRRGVDDGLLLIAALDDRAVRIEVGYGLEGAIPDATANRVIQEYILPAFRRGDFAGGIDAGIGRLVALVDGEPLPAPPAGSAGGSDALAELFPGIFIFALITGGILHRLLGQLPGATLTGLLAGGAAWLTVGVVGIALLMAFLGFFIGLTAGGRGGGGWASHPRGSSRGGRSGGFGGGGGFRGGGGGFGGGGSSGRW